MVRFLQTTFSGLTLGSVLALLSLGWVVVYRVSGVLNLTQGSFLVIGALSFTSLATNNGVPLLLAGGLGVLASVGVAVAVDIAALRPARKGNVAAPIIITLGAAMVLDEASRRLWGNEPLRQAPFLDTKPLDVFGAKVQQHTLLLIGGTVVLLVVLWLVFERTLVGKALQACADSDEGAALVGINPKTMRTAAFAIAGGTGAIAGVLLIPTTAIGWDTGLLLGIKGFIAAVLGSWSYPGAVVAGLLLGLTENYAAGYIASAWKDVVTLSVLLLVLLVRPEGLARRSTSPMRRSRRSTSRGLPRRGRSGRAVPSIPTIVHAHQEGT